MKFYQGFVRCLAKGEASLGERLALECRMVQATSIESSVASFERNAFRLLSLPADAQAKEIYRQQQRIQNALELGDGDFVSLATIHANSAAKALRRFANLVLRSHQQSTYEDIEAEIAEAVDFVIHVERQPDRRVITEVIRLDHYDRRTRQFQLEEIFKLDLDSPLTTVKPC